MSNTTTTSTGNKYDVKPHLHIKLPHNWLQIITNKIDVNKIRNTGFSFFHVKLFI